MKVKKFIKMWIQIKKQIKKNRRLIHKSKNLQQALMINSMNKNETLFIQMQTKPYYGS